MLNVLPRWRLEQATCEGSVCAIPERSSMAIAKTPPITLIEPGEYAVILKDVRLEEFSPSRGAARTRRLNWTFVVDAGEHRGELIYQSLPLRDDPPWVLHKTLYAFGVEVKGKWSFECDKTGRIIDPKLVGGTRACARIFKATSGKTLVRIEPARNA